MPAEIPLWEQVQFPQKQDFVIFRQNGRLARKLDFKQGSYCVSIEKVCLIAGLTAGDIRGLVGIFFRRLIQCVKISRVPEIRKQQEALREVLRQYGRYMRACFGK